MDLSSLPPSEGKTSHSPSLTGGMGMVQNTQTPFLQEAFLFLNRQRASSTSLKMNSQITDTHG